ncbi:bcl-2-related ovarian killer protein-like isoform X1 [Lineus longissimus]|uniref:bcl-2-related ovarian killer protein-like isoform X1 n=1 Tax=Lineus longissimus TaxID=88925 RepID=UPI002B4F3519
MELEVEGKSDSSDSIFEDEATETGTNLKDANSNIKLDPKESVEKVRDIIQAESERYLEEAKRYVGHFQRYSNKMSRNISTGLNLSGVEIPSHEVIMEQSKDLCRDYVFGRLKRQGLTSKKIIAPPEPTEVSEQIQMVGLELEKAYPDLYKGVSRQLNITMSTEDIVRRTFTQIAEYLFRGEPNWGKIVSLFAVAGAFAADCVQQGHPEYVNKIVDAFGNFVGKNVADWVAHQGGWTDIIRCSKGCKDNSLVWALGCIGALVGFVATLMITVQL